MILAHYPHYLSLSIMRENKALFNMKVSNSENNMPKLFETERIFCRKFLKKCWLLIQRYFRFMTLACRYFNLHKLNNLKKWHWHVAYFPRFFFILYVCFITLKLLSKVMIFGILDTIKRNIYYINISNTRSP